MTMFARQLALGLVLLTTPVMAHAGWRAPHGHAGPREPPPAPREEHARTRAGFVWAGGHHNWHRGHYVWVSGRLVRVHHGHDWDDGRWEHHDDHYDWHAGGWRPHR